MSGIVNVQTQRRWIVVAIACLLSLALAAPAVAADQTSNINQSCDSGSTDSTSDGSSDDGSSDDGASDGGSSDESSSANDENCSNQQRSIQQSAGGDADRSVNQTQTFDDDDDRDRTRRNRDDNDEEDVAETTETDFEDLDCRDFSSQADAQAVLDEDVSDPNGLDDDSDGKACEEFFSRAVTSSPEGGVETGGGGTLHPQLTASAGDSSPAASVAKLAGPPLALALIVGGLLGLRRSRLS